MKTLEAEEPVGLAAAAKAHFHPTPPPRETSHEPKEPAAAPAKEPVPPKEAVAKESAKEPAKAPDAPKESAAPANEEDAVFGTPVLKPDATAKKADAPKDDDFEKSLAAEKQGMTEKAGAKWEQLRRSEKAAKDEARAAREELKTAAEARQHEKHPAEDAPKIDALKQENEALKLQLAEMEKDISIVQVERSPKYRREVSEPMGDLTKQTEEIATRYEVSPKTLLEAVQADPKERADLLAELVTDFKEGDRIDLYAIAKDMDRLKRTGEKLREKAKTDFSALEQEEREAQERMTAEVRQTFIASAQRAWKEASDTLDFLRPNAAAPEWNAALVNAQSQSANYVPGQDPIADGRMIAEAHVARFLRKALDHRTKRLAALTEERGRLLERIAADNAHDPGLGGARDEDQVQDDEGGEDLSLGQRVKAKVAR